MTGTRNSDITKENLIETTCEMIKEKGSAASINMRSIARKAGCAHTNIYYYFDSYTDLLYAAMLRTMEKLVAFTQKRVGCQAKQTEHFPTFISAQIDFAIEFPGLFRFFWLERLDGPIPEDIITFGIELKNRFAGLVFNCFGGKKTYDEAMKASIIVHSYLHGEICKMISGRELKLSLSEARQNIIDNVNKLMKLLS